MIKLVVVGWARSGTTYFADLLASHPDVFMRFGLVEFYELAFKGKWRKGITQANWFEVDRPEPVVGFKTLWNHKHLANWVQWLRDDPSITVIEVERWNKFHAVVSWVVAYKTSEWIKSTGEPTQPVISMLPSEVEAKLRVFEEIQLPRWRVDYTQLRFNPDAVMGDVFDRLGLKPSPVESRLMLQGRSMRETVRNYDELKTYFKGGPFADYFDE